ncbi:MAG TPA: PfkB family carbohydrate kinase [Solirubrobacteraceae bacterium]|nr:PfkB family carbohydrate kinase [Solirubrobacteraceae bacterium]
MPEPFAQLKVAVVGHVEYVEFLRVARVPVAGEIAHARYTFAEPAGGGGVAAVQLARLARGATLFTAFGDDEVGRRSAARLEEYGVSVRAAWRSEPQRRAVTFVDDDGERTITVIGERLAPAGADALPWDELAACDGVYVTAGDAAALRAARRARVMVATPRVGPALAEAGVELDALVHSARDSGERYAPGELDPAPRLVVSTGGVSGGTFTAAEGRSGTWRAAPLPGPVVDTYGAGDSFAAGLTLGLAAGLEAEDALALAARCGAVCVTGEGPYGARLEAVTAPPG